MSSLRKSGDVGVAVLVAKDYFGSSTSVFEKLVRIEPMRADWSLSLSASYLSNGFIKMVENEENIALGLFRKAQVINSRFIDQHTEDFGWLLVTASTNLCLSLMSQGGVSKQEAEALGKEATVILQKIRTQFPYVFNIPTSLSKN